MRRKQSPNGTVQYKVPLRRVASDSCAIMLGRVIEDGEITNPGTAHYVHQGEWVDFLPVGSLAEVVQLIDDLRPIKEVLDARHLSKVAGRITARCNRLSKRVIAWNWTDLAGDPLPQPYGKPEVLLNLNNDELLWLIVQAQTSESGSDQKNG